MPDRPDLDRIDRKILAVLQQDGRITNHELSRRAGLSPSACLARVKRLERLGVITGYRAQIDPARLGCCIVVFAELTAAAHDAATVQRIEAGLRAIPEVIEAYQVSGAYDFLVRFLVNDMAAWTEIADRLVASPMNIVTVRSVAALRRLKAWNGVPTGSPAER